MCRKFRVGEAGVYRLLCMIMYHHTELDKKQLASLIRKGAITLGGYKKTKIYGLLSCRAGRRMKEENRVFFKDEKEARSQGYRPCGACLPEQYRRWKEATTGGERG